MRIGIFSWRDLKHPQGGGAELFLHEQAKLWAEKGHEIRWFTSFVKNEPLKEKIDGILFIRKGGRLGVYLWAPIIYFKEMKDCDVIIDAENGIPFFTPLFSKRKKILLIHHIHKDVWFKEFGLPLSWIGYFLEIKIMPLVYKKIPIITVSPSSKEKIIKLIPHNKINIVYNAISKKYKPGKKARSPEVIFVGRLKKYKSIDILLKAVALVNKSLVLNIVGRGDDEKRLRNIAKNLELKNVNFLGFVPEREKIKRIQRAWFAVNPSFVEGWSITNIEANACGTPVIGSNVNGIKDSIKNEITGFLFEYGNVKELAEKIRILLGNRETRKKMSKEAIRWAKNFSWNKSANKFLQILEKLKQRV